VTAEIKPNLTTVPQTTLNMALEHQIPPPPQELEAMETQPDELPNTTTTATREELETQTPQGTIPMEEERTDSQAIVVVVETNL
jgi:hypothetical protein